jgi:glycosyltransferase involved in cell wall biosynthesis
MFESKKNDTPRILVFCDYYLPGYKSGGGMRTIVNMAERLNHKFDFHVVTRDHDGREDFDSYTTVNINEWNELDNAKVFYLPKSEIKMSAIVRRIDEVKPKAIYLNSYFATLAIYVLLLKKLGKIPRIKIILAPCGELTQGSLKLKHFKKKTFRFLADALGIYNNLIWKASSVLEASEIEATKQNRGVIYVAPDLPSKSILQNYAQSMKRKKTCGEVRLVFMSRISAKKNLMWFLELLLQHQGNIVFDIIGPIEDEKYWKQCTAVIDAFPGNIKCSYLGSIPNSEVTERMIDYDFFVLPTLSENFGHVFLEALSAGCPLITTDRTPWLKLYEKNIGWDMSLENRNLWNEVLTKCLRMEDLEYQKMSEASRKFAVNFLADKDVEDATIKVLQHALQQ